MLSASTIAWLSSTIRILARAWTPFAGEPRGCPPSPPILSPSLTALLLVLESYPIRPRLPSLAATCGSPEPGCNCWARATQSRAARHCNFEGRSLPHFALDPDLAVVGIDHRMGQVQAKSRARDFPGLS